MEQFAALLPHAARLATDHLAAVADSSSPVAVPMPPDVLLSRLGPTPGAEGQSAEAVMEAATKALQYSVRTGHPRFFNQLFGGVDPAGILGEWVAALANTSMYTYEVAPAATVMERFLIERLNRLVGFRGGEGIFTPGGSVSNLMAVLAARNRAFPNAKEHGIASAGRPAIFMSAEAHYSTPRAASVAGFGTEGVISVPTDPEGRMEPEALGRAIAAARADSRVPFMVVATSGTTVAGAFDPLAAIADVAERERLWLHVDASYGGGVLFSDRYRGLMAGVDRADSVAWNPHKMMGLPLACSAILVRSQGTLEATNGMQADYLFHGAGGPNPDLGDLSLQCGRRVDAFKLWLSWIALGNQGYADRIDRLFGLAARFRLMVLDREGFELVREPEGTNVCFRYLAAGDRHLGGEARRRRQHEVTKAVRHQLLTSGRFMINYAPIDGVAAFRIVLNNPLTTDADLAALLDAIEEFGSLGPEA